MARYNVVGVDGNVYGPVDEAGLVEWARAGRVVPSTRLIEVSTGQSVAAGSVEPLAAVFRPPVPGGWAGAPAGPVPPPPGPGGFSGQPHGAGRPYPPGQPYTVGQPPQMPQYWQAPGAAPGQPMPGGYGPYAGQAMPNIPTHMTEAILATLLCCLPLGIVSVVYASQVSSKLAAGDVAGALQASNNARTWAWVSFGLGLLGGVLYVAAIAAGTA